MTPKSVFLPIADAYDRWSSFYDGYDNPMVYAASEIVRAQLGPLGAKSFCEFGCGTGRNLQFFADQGASELTGCDLSSGMLAEARRRNSAFRLIQQDLAAALPLPDRSQDLALFCLSLEHVADLTPPLAEARRVIRDTGRAAVIEIHPFLSLGGTAAHFEHEGEEVRMPTYPHQFSDYLNAFSRAGLRIRECREWRPRDFGPDAPLKALKRGPDFPLAVSFLLSAGSDGTP